MRQTLENRNLGKTISELFPDLYRMSRPITTPDVPIIVAASILSLYDAPMLPIVKVGESPIAEKEGVKLYQAVGSEPVIRLLTETKPGDYYKVLWNPCMAASIWIGSLSYDDTIDKLLSIYELTGFGDARVDVPHLPPALLTLNEVTSLYKYRKLRCGMMAKEIASRVLSVGQDAILIDAMRLMVAKRVRRLFLDGRKGEFISDRAILGFLFSPEGLKVARDQPSLWTDLRVSDIRTREAQTISSDATVEDVGSLDHPGHDVFLLPDGNSLISRWDLVLRPWKAGRLRVST